ncbi:MAG: hypothetical protein FRX48_00249 [Lasallia pustulata]|uniref:RNA polymerase I-specific transcription initiation factor RRN3 n=1 Tax=Lasallia pustulata TaxID=136370 RepID=A0A5M8Q2Y0_9LECA|nr:MAG: hypothetical protein FRX48_00249 [Lasallia pustulata]
MTHDHIHENLQTLQTLQNDFDYHPHDTLTLSMVSMVSTAPRALGPAPAPTVKQPLRRPTLVRKRDDTDMEFNGPPSPGKRAKVSFDSKVQVRIVDEWEKAPELIREEVHRALEKQAAGDNSSYDKVVEIYTAKPSGEDAPSPTTIKNYTVALLGNVSLLNKSASTLVHALLDSQWLGRDEAYVTLYGRLLRNLVSAQAGYLTDVLRMLVNNLTSAPPSDCRLPNYAVVRRSQIHSRSLTAITYLLRVIPSASSILCPLLAQTFPYISESRRAHTIYVENLLRLVGSTPELRSEVLALITERLVKIDVQVQVDIEDLAEDVEEGLVQGLKRIRGGPSHESDDSDDSDDDSVTSDETLDKEIQRTKDIKANVDKMDMIMDTLFAHYSPTFSGTQTVDAEITLDIMLSQFATIILPTTGCRHTQFLLFHFAQTSPLFIDHFVGACIHIAFDRSRPAIARQLAAAYLASFVARGIHVPSQTVRDVFDYIGTHLTVLRSAYEQNCAGPDLRRYASFYSLVQAIMYIFCFRWRDLEAGPDEHVEDDELPLVDSQERIWTPGVKEILERNIFSKLNPLKVCSPAIVSEFARMSHHLGVTYVYSLLETNKRLRLSQFSGPMHSTGAYNQPERETALSARRDESYQQLDEYFPFDPYHLAQSKRWIEGDYREWEGIPGLDDAKDVDSASDSEDEDDPGGEAEEGIESDDASDSS